jgi:hypothetical protein
MTLRNTTRLLHFIAAGWLGTFIYSPWGTNPTFLLATRLGLVPLLSVTGLVLWKQAALQRLFRKTEVAHVAR